MKTSIKILSCVAAALGGLANVGSARAGDLDAFGVCDHVCSPGGYGGYGGGYAGYGDGYGGYGSAYDDRYAAYDDYSRFGNDHRAEYRGRLEQVGRQAVDVNPRFRTSINADQVAPAQPRQFPRTQFERQQLQRQQIEQGRFGESQVPAQGIAPQQSVAPQQSFPSQTGVAPQQGFGRQDGSSANRTAPQQTFPPQQTGGQQFAPRDNGQVVPNDRPQFDPNAGNANPGAGRPSPLDALREIPSDLPPGESAPQEPSLDSRPPQSLAPEQQGAGLRPTAFGALGGFAGL